MTNETVVAAKDATLDTYPNLSDKLLASENQKSASSKYELKCDESPTLNEDSHVAIGDKKAGSQKK